MGNSSQVNSLRGYIILSLAWLTVVGVVWFTARKPAPSPIEIKPAPTAAPTATAAPSPTAQPSPTASPLRVDVAGSVQNPGVYRLPSGSIVADAISAAGGPAPGAALDRLNKAASLQDGMQVYVPEVNQTAVPTALVPQAPVRSSGPANLPVAPMTPTGKQGSAESLPPGYTVDINRATAEELEALPGIGPSLAARIIDGRPYGTPDDLLRVAGIGPATLLKIRPYVVVQ